MGQPDQDMPIRGYLIGYGLTLLALVYVIENGGHKAKLLILIFILSERGFFTLKIHSHLSTDLRLFSARSDAVGIRLFEVRFWNPDFL